MNGASLLKNGLFSASVLALIALPICALLFGCGCRHLFAGGIHHCELLPGTVAGKHTCPWCALTRLSLIGVFAPTVLVSTIFGVWMRSRMGFAAGYFTSATACLVLLLGTGLVMGRLSGFEPRQDRFSLCGWVSE
ncbi:MAG: hypothetical protein VYA30_16905 [Myxococcota bacterium]|nr:hypothetical protein [Myxococcota bacterium]